MNKLKFYRERAGFTQEQMANFLGLSKSGYCLKELGKRRFKIEEAVKVSDLLKQPIKKIF